MGRQVYLRSASHHARSVICASFASLALSAVLLSSPVQAQTVALSQEQATPQKKLSPAGQKPAAAPKVAATTAAATTSPDATTGATSSDPAAEKPKKPAAGRGAKGPYYVDFRSRTAASYGHAFVWFGKSSDRKVDIAGLHPAGDEIPFVLGHVIPVPAETGASYGDLDVQYLTASYRVYMNEADAKRVFAHIRKLQSTNKFWNEMTNNCTSFLGDIASYMGLKTPFYIKVPEDYVNELKAMNGGKQFITLPPEQTSSIQ